MNLNYNPCKIKFSSSSSLSLSGQNIGGFSGKRGGGGGGSSQENGPLTVKGQDRKSKRSRQRNKREYRNRESNDSPAVPD